jgi:hypothetical protein
MATLLLGAVGGSLGGAFGGGIGAALGRAAGAIAGQVIDGALFGKPRKIEGPRLNDLDVQASSEGSAIPRVYGRARLSGQMIWATRYEEEATTERQGGKGGPKVTSTTYSYYANFAIGLCEGEITHFGRIWADGKPLDTTSLTIRYYKGTENQTPDPLIEAKEGIAPAYRGLAYIVFEHLPIADFGNRLPQISVEVIRKLPGGIEDSIRAITLIPGAGEFAYEPDTITRTPSAGVTEPENRHISIAQSNWDASLNELEALCPNLERAGLVVSWFGDDLRAGHCQIEPRVENATKVTTNKSWSVAGLSRSSAKVVSTVNDAPAYGGSPDDASVSAAIQDIKARGLKVTFFPFIMMDIASDNSLPNPWTGEADQPAYPWRGRITCDPASEEAGTVDKTSAVQGQIASFTGTAARSDFSITGTQVVYSGPAEWSFRRFILHYAHLCAAAGGVDAFVIGSELRGMTPLRDHTNAFPFVEDLVALAADVKAILGSGTIVTYGADWSEYASHRPPDGSGDVYFHLDALWASPHIDVVGIDNYLPLSDWRESENHLDGQDGASSVYEKAYLQANIAGGEYADWYYENDAARFAQTRTDITDGTYGKPWVFANKSLKDWWENPHYNRPGGVESASPTGWTAQSKPIWFLELGCPAVHLGANQPNVFPDPKSSESAYPWFSTGTRDDAMQRRFLDAHLSWWDGDALSDVTNPSSSQYSGRMVEGSAIHLWTWDARPFPWFPYMQSVWADGVNWQTGHWLTGRLGTAPLDLLIKAICEDYGFYDVDSTQLYQTVDGYVIDRPMSARAAIEPLTQLLGFDAHEHGSEIVFKPRGQGEAQDVSQESAQAEAGKPIIERQRAQETELPPTISIGFINGAADYRKSLARSRKLAGQSLRENAIDVAVIADGALIDRAADIVLQDLWAARETLQLSLPPSYMALEPGDLLYLEGQDVSYVFEITQIEDGLSRTIECRKIEPSVFSAASLAPRDVTISSASQFGPADVIPLDLPLFNESDPHGARIAAFAEPWPGRLAILQSTGETGFSVIQILGARATTGWLEDALSAGPTGVWDDGNTLIVRLSSGGLSSRDDEAVFSGANVCAVQADNGEWEILQFGTAELIAEKTWRLTHLLRGLGGTEDAMAAGSASNARFVLLNAATTLLDVAQDSLDLIRNWRIGPASRDYTDASYKALSFAPGTRGLEPLSPIHITLTRTDPSNDLLISWIRRTRISGDGWEQADVPLGEETENWRLEIYDGSTLIRTVSLTDSEWLYTNDNQISDFGASITTLDLKICQLGTGGREGISASTTVIVSKTLSDS